MPPDRQKALVLKLMEVVQQQGISELHPLDYSVKTAYANGKIIWLKHYIVMTLIQESRGFLIPKKAQNKAGI